MSDEMRLLIDYAKSFLGVAYIYGGNNRLTGFDCSGFICEVLRSTGLVGNFEDLNAFAIFKKDFLCFAPQDVPSVCGTLLFYGTSLESIDHIALQLDPYRVIECGGGNSHTNSITDAMKLGAMVRIRPMTLRHDLVATRRPIYPWEMSK